MSRIASRRVVVLFPLVLFALLASAPASALALSSHHRRTHHHRRHRRRSVRAHRGAAPPRPAPADACPNSGASASSASLATMQSAVVCELNLARSAHGLPALSESGALASSAQGWSRSMVAMHQLSHGADFSARISAVGYPWGVAGENIAAGYSTPRSVVAAWMGSLDHCQNILDPRFRDVGVGEVPSPLSAGLGAGTWTADFGLKLLAAPPSGNWGPANGCPY